MSIVSIIKQTAIEAVEESSPMTVTYGIVTSSNPLKVTIEQRLSITKSYIINTEMFEKEAFSIGDNLLLLRVQGGQKYIFIDKLVKS